MLLEPLQNNKAWQLRIDLRGTSAFGCAPKQLNLHSLDGTWLRCTLGPMRFDGAGSEVEEMIAVFRRWIELDSPDAGSTLYEEAPAV